MEWLNDNSWAVWLGLALALGAIEAATADFVFLMLAAGAVAGLVAGLITGSIAIQIIAAAAVSLVLLGTVRPVLKRRMLDALPGTGIGIETYAGRTARVTEPVTDADGRVEFDGEVWTARTESPVQIPLQVDSEVSIVRVDGASLIVEAGPMQDVVRGGDA